MCYEWYGFCFNILICISISADASIKMVIPIKHLNISVSFDEMLEMLDAKWFLSN